MVRRYAQHIFAPSDAVLEPPLSNRCIERGDNEIYLVDLLRFQGASIIDPPPVILAAASIIQNSVIWSRVAGS